MARFLFCPVPEAGDVYPTVPVALDLQSRGHDVAYLTSADFAPDLHNERIRCYVAAGGVYGTGIPAHADTKHTPLERLRLQVQTLEQVFDEFRADVLVDGAFPFGPRLFSELRGVPRASVHSGCYPIPTRDPLFPYGPGKLPPASERERMLARLANLVQEEGERDEVAAWDAARVSIGLPASGVNPARSESSPCLSLLACSPAFEYPRSDMPAHYWFTGPLTWESRLARMPERVANLPGRQPVVYVSQGATYNRNPLVLKLALEALASEPVHVVATVVRAFENAEFDPVPSNAILTRFVPFSRLVERLSLVITHGGAGAVQTALSRGIPVIVMPLTADQFEVAARCVWTGAGIRLDPWRSTADQLRKAVQTVLADPSYRTNARRIMDSCARAGGARLAGSLLERLAETREPILRPSSACNPWEETAWTPSTATTNAIYMETHYVD